MTILALDLGCACGWALYHHDREGTGASFTLVSGVQKFDLERGESPGMRTLRFRSWIEGMVLHLLADERAAVFYERPHLRGGYAAQALSSFESEVLAACAARGIEHRALHSGTVKKAATGKGNAGKPAMVEAANAAWGTTLEPNNEDHWDEADALGVLTLAVKEIGTP